MPAARATAAAASRLWRGVAIMCTWWPAKRASPGLATRRRRSPARRARRPDFDAVAVQDRQRVGAGGAVGHRGAAGDDFGRVARHVADQERHHARRRAVGREPPALDRREVLAHAVHLVDGRAALEQRLVDGLLLLQRDAGRGQRQQRRAAAGDQAQHEIVGREPCASCAMRCAARRPASSGTGCAASTTSMRPGFAL